MSSDQQYPHDPGVAQTWEGQTWDTHYQPAVPSDPDPLPPAANGTGWPPQQGPGAHPLPPEAPRAEAYDAPTAYLPPVADQGPAPYGQPPAQGYDAPTAYLPPVTDHGPAPYGQPPAQGYDAPTAYLPPVTGQGPAPYGQPASAPHAPAPAAPAPSAPAPAAHAPAHTGAVPAAVGAPAAADHGGHAPAGAAHEPEYSAPTTLGNTRITDAQRARAEGRSPIIDPGIQPAGLTALFGLLLAGGAALGPYALLVPLVLLQAVTAAGWFRLNGMWPARQGIALAFLGGLVADAALLATGREHGPAAILGTLGVWVLLVLVLQLRSHAAAEERLYGLMATVVSSALAVVATAFLAAEPDAVVAGALAAAAATVVRALPLPGPASLVAALAAGAGAGLAAGAVTGLGAVAAVLGLAAGVCAVTGLRVAAYDYPSRFVHMTAGVALPLALAAPAVYLLGRVLV
ncbi:hypothetical protein [Streptomyces sp. NPDC050585]|uniref:hypothetical protein n=1 Tax=Streptomyces sp. NPDC050585 TaxID=3365632 RepID=UPI0037AF20B3